MESNRNTTTLSFQERGGKKPSLTPRELINYHIENPEDPITDEDIRNLNLSPQVSNFTANNFFQAER